MSDRGDFRVERTESAGGISLTLEGVIDEHADVSFFVELRGRVRLNLGRLRRINSFGVRTWLDGISRVHDDAQIELEECPPPFVDQINLLTSFLGPARVVSFLAPFVCPACDHEQDELVEVAACVERGYRLPDDVRCDACGEIAELDGVEAMYLRFLHEGW